VQVKWHNDRESSLYDCEMQIFYQRRLGTSHVRCQQSFWQVETQVAQAHCYVCVINTLRDTIQCKESVSERG